MRRLQNGGQGGVKILLERVEGRGAEAKLGRVSNGMEELVKARECSEQKCDVKNYCGACWVRIWGRGRLERKKGPVRLGRRTVQQLRTEMRMVRTWVATEVEKR